MSWVAPTNQASPLFSVVPVLPHSVEAPVAARVPVPWETTCREDRPGGGGDVGGHDLLGLDLVLAGIAVVGLDQVAAHTGSLVADLLDPDRAAVGGGHRAAYPLAVVARVWKACAMSSGVTPCSRPPRIIAGLVEIGVSIAHRVGRLGDVLGGRP